jgi:hypothetical protein
MTPEQTGLEEAENHNNDDGTCASGTGTCGTGDNNDDGTAQAAPTPSSS